MDFRTLRYFVTVAQELNFSHAAEKLHMSQPPLSTQIRELEKDLGVQLFIRGRRRLSLTEAGQLYYRRAIQILDLADRTRSELSGYGKELSGKLSIGMVEGRAPFLTADWITGFREEYPLVTFALHNGSTDDVLEQLRHGIVDLAVIAAPYDTEALDAVAVGREPWVALIPPDHPLAKEEGNELELKRLDKIPLIVPQRTSRIESIQRWFEEAGADPDIVCTMSSYIDANALVVHGAGVAIFPQTTYMPTPGMVTKVLTGPPKYAEYLLVWYRESKPGGVAQEFVEYVRDRMEEGRESAGKVRGAGGGYALPDGATLL